MKKIKSDHQAGVVADEFDATKSMKEMKGHHQVFLYGPDTLKQLKSHLK